MTGGLGGADWRIVLTIAVVVIIAMVLGYRLMHRDDRIWRTRYGFFAERDRYQNDDEVEEPPAAADETQVWPRRDDG